jgi:hypothetical protein
VTDREVSIVIAAQAANIGIIGARTDGLHQRTVVDRLRIEDVATAVARTIQNVGTRNMLNILDAVQVRLQAAARSRELS